MTIKVRPFLETLARTPVSLENKIHKIVAVDETEIAPVGQCF